MCGDWHQSQDLVQECLAKMYVVWHRIHRREPLDAYARKVMLRIYLSQRRLKRSGELPAAELGEVLAPGDDPELRMTLVAALRELPPRNRAVVVLLYFEDYSIEMTADALGTTAAAIKSINTRSLRKLRASLGTDSEPLLER
jgi:RNA polymerase sigma factor (sigma-70 family)